MFSRILCAALAGLALAPLEAAAHCFVGARFLPATLTIDDPCVADELSLPTVARFNTGDDPSARQLDISGEYSKRITATGPMPAPPRRVAERSRPGAATRPPADRHTTGRSAG